MRVLKPRFYRGVRDTQELENFLFDIEQYFCAMKLDSNEAKVIIATKYLIGNAKLWWQTKYEDIIMG